MIGNEGNAELNLLRIGATIAKDKESVDKLIEKEIEMSKGNQLSNNMFFLHYLW